jgi:uncharacterized membrane protein
MNPLLVVCGVLLVASGVLGGLGLLRPNYFAGYRTRRTRRSRAAWYAAHRAAAVPTVAAGLLLAGIGLVVERGRGLLLVLVALVPVLVALRLGERAADAAPDDPPAPQDARSG